MKRADYLQMHQERRELILAAIRAGRAYPEIAAEYGVTPERISQIAVEAGHRKRRPYKRQRKAPHGHAEP